MRKYLQLYFSKNQNLIAFCFGVLTFAICIMVLFSEPRVAMLDSGQYDVVMSNYGLTRSESIYSQEEYYTKANEYFSINGTPWSALLQINPTSSIVYPISLINLVCSIVGYSFSTIGLSILLSLLLSISVYIFLKSLYIYIHGLCIGVGALISGILLCGNYIIPFSSLYSRGMFLVSLFLFIAFYLRGNALLLEDNISKKKILVPQIITALLLLTSVESGIFLILPVLVLLGISLFKCAQRSFISIKLIIFAVISTLVLVFASLYSCFHSTILFSKTNLYHSVFNGILVYADNKQQALDYFGLDHNFMQDIGKTVYYPEDEYYISPNSDDANSQIYQNISYAKIISYYLNHPNTLKTALSTSINRTSTLSYDQFIYAEDSLSSDSGTRNVYRYDFWNIVRSILFENPMVYPLIWISIIIVSLYLLIFNKISVAIIPIVAVITNMLLSISMFLPSGLTDLAVNAYPFQLTFDMLFIVSIMYIVGGVRWLVRQLAYSSLSIRNNREDEYPFELYSDGLVCSIIRDKDYINKSKTVLRRILYDKKAFSLTTTLICAFIIISVIFFPRIGAYNNGDFGRMMDAMNISYTPEDFYNPSEQYVTKVIEDFDYKEPYDWTIIRPSMMGLSQSWISVLMRGIYSLTGLSFSTAIVAFIYSLIIIICFYQFMRSSWQFLGPQTSVLVSVLFILMFCGSYNLGWFNSLYGEAVGFVGLMMVIASSLYIIENSQRKRIGFIFLSVSSLFLCCAKAQYTVLAPVLIIWLLILGIIYRPKKIIKLTAYFLCFTLSFIFIGTAAVSVYQKDSALSSQDTLYQGLCNGILLVADDPVVALQELGLDTRLAQDAGKNAYLPDDQYFCVPRSELADELIYSKVSSIDYLVWYLQHPTAFLNILDAAATASSDEMPDYFLYVGEKTSEKHRTVSKLSLWQDIRPFMTPNYFFIYVIVFGTILVIAIISLIRKQLSPPQKLHVVLLIMVMGLGVIQYPLTVIGNGFSDNIKQLYLFREIYDLVLLVSAIWIFKYLYPKCKNFIKHLLSEKE